MRFDSWERLEPRQLMAADPPWKIYEKITPTGSQLQVLGTGTADRITISKMSRGYVVGDGSGFSATYNGKYSSILIDAGAGNDTVSIASSVVIPSILKGGPGADILSAGSGADSIFGGGGADKLIGNAGNDTLVSVADSTPASLTGGAGNDSFWLDAKTTRVTDLSKTESQKGAFHHIASFFKTVGTVATEMLKTALPDPTIADAGVSYHNFATHPLFSNAGPKADDVTQGQRGDCYFLASLAAVAKTDPWQIKQMVTDLGDGTFAVRFRRGGKDSFVRVDADLPAYSTGSLAYASQGAQGAIWAPIMEKAYAVYRTGANDYRSVDRGWMTEAFNDLGLRVSSYYDGRSASTLITQIEEMLRSGKAVTFATSETGPNSSLMSFHAYTVTGLEKTPAKGKNAKGFSDVKLVLRNPWGIDGRAVSDGKNDGYITISASQAAAAFNGVVAGQT